MYRESQERNITVWRIKTVKRTTYQGFEVFTAVVKKSMFFWDMTPYSQLTTRRHISEEDTLHLSGNLPQM
jgi:hypothetical protein